MTKVKRDKYMRFGCFTIKESTDAFNMEGYVGVDYAYIFDRENSAESNIKLL